MVSTVFCLYLGSTGARRGDVIRCTVMFEDKLQVDGETRVNETKRNVFETFSFILFG